jgi:Zn finger protein HypA/HybF involved in hydrogenase expression
VLPDAVRFCFEVCAKDTVVEGATLEIIEVTGGQELKIKEVEIEVE